MGLRISREVISDLSFLIREPNSHWLRRLFWIFAFWAFFYWDRFRTPLILTHNLVARSPEYFHLCCNKKMKEEKDKWRISASNDFSLSPPYANICIITFNFSYTLIGIVLRTREIITGFYSTIILKIRYCLCGATSCAVHTYSEFMWAISRLLNRTTSVFW